MIINVFAGQTIAFNLNVIGHPFLIRETAGGANTSEGLIHISPSLVVSTGLDAQGKVDGTLYWTIPHYLEGSTYVYQCFIHTGAMVGNIAIGQAYPRANDVTTDTLVISANIKEINLTSTLNVGTDANIYGNLTVVGDYSFGDYDFPPGSDLNIETANVTNLIGEANTQIYNTIANSYVKNKTNDLLTVKRGMYNTSAVEHVGGTGILIITSADNDLIQAGDDFGFGG